MHRIPFSFMALVALLGCGGSQTVLPVDHDHLGIEGLRNPALEKSAEAKSGLAEARRATAQFHNFDKALAAGYTVWSPNPASGSCPSNAEGNMGYHLVNVGLRGSASDPAAADATIDLTKPEMLLYEKLPSGKMKLVGVEYLVFTAAWEREQGVGAAPPEVMGRPLPASSHTFPPGNVSIPHYELHVWIWSPNPLGMFYPYNPDISC